MDDVSRIHIPENMVGFAENLDTVVVDTPVAGESVLERQGQIYRQFYFCWANFFFKLKFPSNFFYLLLAQTGYSNSRNANLHLFLELSLSLQSDHKIFVLLSPCDQVVAGVLQRDGEAKPSGQDQELRHLPQHHRGGAQVRPGPGPTMIMIILRMDHYSRIFFPMAFIVMNCVYWCIVLI